MPGRGRHAAEKLHDRRRRRRYRYLRGLGVFVLAISGSVTAYALNTFAPQRAPRTPAPPKVNTFLPPRLNITQAGG